MLALPRTKRHRAAPGWPASCVNWPVDGPDQGQSAVFWASRNTAPIVLFGLPAPLLMVLM
jgi:hypothetical protein